MAHDLVRLMHSLFLPAIEAVQEVPWRPAADIYRTPTGWLIKFDLAGVRREDIQLTVQGRSLEVSGRRRDRCMEEGCIHYMLEISYSYFKRRIELPVNLEHADITAEHREGMVLVRIQTEDNG
jgi:HSP20 family protein